MKKGYFHLGLGVAAMLSACNESPKNAVTTAHPVAAVNPVTQSQTPTPAPHRPAPPRPSPSATPTPVPAPTPVCTPAPAPSLTPSPASRPDLAARLNISVDQDLRRFDSPVVHQFGGTCSTFAVAAAMDNVLRSKGVHDEVSEQHLWSTYRTFNYLDAVNAGAANYLTSERYWTVEGVQNPGYLNHATMRISQFHDYQDKLEEALKDLSSGHPLVMAIQVPRDLFNCEKEVGENSLRTHGAHVVAVVGYHLDDQVPGGGYFILKNSWGPDCGDHGYQHYPFSLCKRSDLYCYFVGINDVEVRTQNSSTLDEPLKFP